MSVILALEMLCQEAHELEASLDYISRACLKPNQISKQANKQMNKYSQILIFSLFGDLQIHKQIDEKFISSKVSVSLACSQPFSSVII